MKDSSQHSERKRGKKRNTRSLSSKVRNAVAVSCILLGLLIQIIGITLYGMILVREYEHLATNAAKQVAVAVRHSSDYDTLAQDILAVYTAHTKAEREAMDPETYRALYAQIEQNRPYNFLVGMLQYHCSTTDSSNVFIAVPDPDSNRLIVVADALNSDVQKPGDLTDISEGFLNAFGKWNKEGELLEYRLIRKGGLVCTVAVPVENEEGNFVAYLFADMAMRSLIADLNRFALPITLAILLVTALITWILVRMMRREVVNPINAIAGAAQTYVSDKRSGAETSDHFANLNIQAGEEVENLAETMADMERSLQEIEQVLTKTTAENERISTELGLARRIQAETLPNIFPPFPERKEFGIYASMRPAKEVGGDFYDFFLLDADHLGMVIADVSDKGVPAALFMMISKMLVQNYASIGGSPAEVLETVNNQISKNNKERMFVTVWLGILDLKTGRLTATNAGHEYPVMKQPNGSFEIVKDKHGLIVGVKGGIHYRNYELQLEKGAKLFVYTDGVPEATDSDKKMFGMDRLLKCLTEVENEDPQRIIEHMRSRIDEFAGKAPQFDDITMLCLQYNGPELPVKECKLPAVVDSIQRAADFVAEELEGMACPVKTRSLLSVAVDEIMSNIVHYAYGMGIGDVIVRTEMQESPRGVRVTFIDSGTAFNPLEAKEPDVHADEQERTADGLGIFLARKMVDDMTYERVDGQNILRITKRLPVGI